MAEPVVGAARLSCVFVEDGIETDDVTKLDDDPEMDDVIDPNQFRMLSFNSHVTSLKVRNAADGKQRFVRTCRLPIKLRELTLSKFFLTTNDISIIGRALRHLVVFKIYSCYVPSEFVWFVDDEDFPKLEVLKLRDLDIHKWIVSEDCFLNLKQLWVEKCENLDEIPLEFESLPMLQHILVRECAPSVDDTARQIEKEQHEAQNLEMRVCIHPRNW